MEKLTWTWKKIVAVIAGILGIGTITSCYGMPVDGYYSDPTPENLLGTVKGDIDGDSDTKPTPIEGIKVSAVLTYNNEVIDQTYTDINGEFNLHLGTSYYTDDVILHFEDVDGAEHGAFSSKKDHIYSESDTYFLDRVEENPED